LVDFNSRGALPLILQPEFISFVLEIARENPRNFFLIQLFFGCHTQHSKVGAFGPLFFNGFVLNQKTASPSFFIIGFVI
jgi:hypothetical protein